MQFPLVRYMPLNVTTLYYVRLGKQLNITNSMFADGTYALLANRNVYVNATQSVCHPQVSQEEEQVFHVKQQGVRILTTWAA